MKPFHLLFLIINISTQSSNTFRIEEANIELELENKWELTSKTGRIDYGKVQYSFSHPHVAGENREGNPSITITVDKGSWFDGEEEYLEEKLAFHRSMEDVLEKPIPYGNEINPLKHLTAYYTEGKSGLENNPYGQKMLLVTYWGEEFGLHIEIQTSKQDYEDNPDYYYGIIASIKPIVN